MFQASAPSAGGYGEPTQLSSPNRDLAETQIRTNFQATRGLFWWGRNIASGRQPTATRSTSEYLRPYYITILQVSRKCFITSLQLRTPSDFTHLNLTFGPHLSAASLPAHGIARKPLTRHSSESWHHTPGNGNYIILGYASGKVDAPRTLIPTIIQNCMWYSRVTRLHTKTLK